MKNVLNGYKVCVEEKPKMRKRLEREERIYCDQVVPNAKKAAIEYLVKESVKYKVVDRMRIAYDLLTEVSEGLQSNGYCVLDAVLETSTRLLVGASEGSLKGVFEVGMVFDPILDLPIIPGPSLKGAMKSAARSLCMDPAGDGEKCDKVIKELFGTSAKSEAWVGKLIFFDSYPVVIAEAHHEGSFKALIMPDVITPHYYKGGKPVSSELSASPVPVQHVSVAEGVPFRFVIGVTQDGVRALERYGSMTDLGNSWALALLSLLLGALKIWGVGARTTKGYGLFEIPGSEVARVAGLKVGCGQ